MEVVVMRISCNSVIANLKSSITLVLYNVHMQQNLQLSSIVAAMNTWIGDNASQSWKVRRLWQMLQFIPIIYKFHLFSHTAINIAIKANVVWKNLIIGWKNCRICREMLALRIDPTATHLNDVLREVWKELDASLEVFTTSFRHAGVLLEKDRFLTRSCKR